MLSEDNAQKSVPRAAPPPTGARKASPSLFASASAVREPYGYWRSVFSEHLAEMYEVMCSGLKGRGVTTASIPFDDFCRFVFRRSTGDVPLSFGLEAARQTRAEDR